MKPTEQTIQQIERTLRKIAQKFPSADEPEHMTDIHLRVVQESGEFLAFNDDEEEITRSVIEQWIDNKEEDFYPQVAEFLRNHLHENSNLADNLGIIKPYSFVLEDDEGNDIAEIYLADDDTIIIGGDIMPNLEDELDSFFKNLMD